MSYKVIRAEKKQEGGYYFVSDTSDSMESEKKKMIKINRNTFYYLLQRFLPDKTTNYRWKK